MAGLVPAIHVFLRRRSKDVDARHKAGQDEPIRKLMGTLPGRESPDDHALSL
jgi:hypothetical protein